MLTHFGKEISKIKKEFELQKLRDDLTITAVAKKADLDRSTVYTVLNGGRYRNGVMRYPTIECVLAVANALGLRLRISRRSAA